VRLPLAILCLALSGCGTIAHIDPPLHFAPSELAAYVSASEDAMAVGGDVYYVRDTHSMEPTLWGGDYLASDPNAPYKDRVAGEIAVYDADWVPDADPYVTHRIAAITSTGWIMSGDNNATSEAQWRVTADEYKGLVVAIWRVSK
jgi:uncharacterized protein YceK